MKKKLLSIILIFVAITSIGQITITNNNIAPAGTTIYVANDTTFATGITPGDPGANKTWNFTNIIANTIDTLDFILPSATPHAIVFPAANFALSSNSEEGIYYAYMIRNDDKLASIGYVVESEEFGILYNYVTPEEIIIDFPMNYDNSYNELYITDMVMASPMPGADSIRTKSTVEKETTIDAWGTLTMPMGTYDVLRQHVEETQLDSTFMYMGGQWIYISESEYSSISYSWWTDDSSIDFMLFSIDVDPLTGEVGSVSFYQGSHVGVTETNMVSTKVYPNPASDMLHFEYEQIVSGNLIVSNQLGQVVLREKLENQTNLNINISQLKTGVYFYQTTSNSGELLSSGKIVKR